MKIRWGASATKPFNKFPHQDRIKEGIFATLKQRNRILEHVACRVRANGRGRQPGKSTEKVLKHQVPMG